jgi:hypothetical protein
MRQRFGHEAVVVRADDRRVAVPFVDLPPGHGNVGLITRPGGRSRDRTTAIWQHRSHDIEGCPVFSGEARQAKPTDIGWRRRLVGSPFAQAFNQSPGGGQLRVVVCGTRRMVRIAQCLEGGHDLGQHLFSHHEIAAALGENP